ncbi:MAG TPA: shikimate kinase [Solirubrobacteraceae bacterium]
MTRSADPKTNPDDRPRHIVLIGMMGSGKSSIGRALAVRLGVPYHDNDDALVVRTGRTAAAIAAEEGAPRLHELEESILTETLAGADGAVVSAPGVIALESDAAAMLRGQVVVWLRARPETLAARVRGSSGRPLIGAASVETLGELAAVRDPGYARLASVVVDVDGRSVDDIATEIMRGLPTVDGEHRAR